MVDTPINVNSTPLPPEGLQNSQAQRSKQGEPQPTSTPKTVTDRHTSQVDTSDAVDKELQVDFGDMQEGLDLEFANLFAEEQGHLDAQDQNVEEQNLNDTIQEQKLKLKQYQQKIKDAKDSGAKIDFTIQQAGEMTKLLDKLETNLAKLKDLKAKSGVEESSEDTTVEGIRQDFVEPMREFVAETVAEFKDGTIAEIDRILNNPEIKLTKAQRERFEELRAKLEDLDLSDIKDLDDLLDKFKDDEVALKIIQGILRNARYDNNGNLVLNEGDREQIFTDAFNTLFKDDQDLLDIFIRNARMDFLKDFFGAESREHAFSLMEQSFERIGVEYKLSTNKTSDEIKQAQSAKQKAAVEEAKAEEIRVADQKALDEITNVIETIGTLSTDLIAVYLQKGFITFDDVVSSEGRVALVEEIKQGGGKLTNALGGIQAIKDKLGSSMATPEQKQEIYGAIVSWEWRQE